MRTGTAEVASVPSRDDGRNVKIGKNVEALGGTKELVSTNVLVKQCCIRQRHTASPGIHDNVELLCLSLLIQCMLMMLIKLKGLNPSFDICAIKQGTRMFNVKSHWNGIVHCKLMFSFLEKATAGSYL